MFAQKPPAKHSKNIAKHTKKRKKNCENRKKNIVFGGLGGFSMVCLDFSMVFDFLNVFLGFLMPKTLV